MEKLYRNATGLSNAQSPDEQTITKMSKPMNRRTNTQKKRTNKLMRRKMGCHLTRNRMMGLYMN